jgi:hypothetical protein
MSKRHWSWVPAALLLVLGPSLPPAVQAEPAGFENARRILKELLARAPDVKELRLEADHVAVLVLDSDADGPRIRMNPGVLRTIESRWPPEQADRVLTVIFARLIGQIQAGQPVGGEVLYTLEQLDEASCRAVRLLGREWYVQYLVDVFDRDDDDAAAETDRLLSKCN